MSVVAPLFFFCFIGTLTARQPDIDINRVKLLPKASIRHIDTTKSFHTRRSTVNRNLFSRNNDYDDNSSRFAQLLTPIQFRRDTTTYADPKTPIKVHQPRQDPRLFYQSDAYIKEANGHNVNRQVSSIYPGREVVRAGEQNRRPLRMKYREANDITEGLNPCVRCPHDRTLIAKAGVDKVMVQYPRLVACSGRKAPRDTRFVHMYGPRFGAILGQGAHMIIGQITHKNQILQTCKMQIHVLIQSCPVPKYLVAHCGDHNKTCSFTCRAPDMNLKGQTTATCGDDMKWTDPLPICRVRTWCDPPPPPEHGRISCKGTTVDNGWGLAEGSSCRVKCVRGWRLSERAAAVCRRGAWTHTLTCHSKTKRRK